MTSTADATPTVLFYNLLAQDLDERGFNVRITSLYQEQPPSSPWTLGLRVLPRDCAVRGVQGHFSFDLDVSAWEGTSALVESSTVWFETLTHQPAELAGETVSAADKKLQEAIDSATYNTCGWIHTPGYRELADAIEAAMAEADLIPGQQDEPEDL